MLKTRVTVYLRPDKTATYTSKASSSLSLSVLGPSLYICAEYSFRDEKSFERAEKRA